MGSNGALEASRTSSSMSSMAASPAHTARDPAASAVSAAAVVPAQHHIKATSSERMNNYMSEDDNLDVPLFVTDPTINNKGQEISEGDHKDSKESDNFFVQIAALRIYNG